MWLSSRKHIVYEQQVCGFLSHIKVKAETFGSMVLKVKIGDSAPVVMVLDGKLEASFPYSISEPANVYIYGGESASGAPMHRASGDNALKIYGISWEETGMSISVPLNDNGDIIMIIGTPWTVASCKAGRRRRVCISVMAVRS